MNSIIPESGHINSILLGNSASRWFAEHNILPSSWDLPPEEMSRIHSSGLRITSFSGPAGSMDLSNNPFEGNRQVRQVIIDQNLLEDGILDRREFIATILHEIGHILNPRPNPTTPTEIAAYSADKNGEEYADDYTRKLNYGPQLCGALEKLKKYDRKRFETDLTIRRLQRIYNQADIKMNLIK